MQHISQGILIHLLYMTDLGQSVFGPAQNDSKILNKYLIITVSKRNTFSFPLEMQRKWSSARKCHMSTMSQIYQRQVQSWNFQFNRWFWVPKTNLIQRISGVKTESSGSCTAVPTNLKILTFWGFVEQGGVCILDYQGCVSEKAIQFNLK